MPAREPVNILLVDDHPAKLLSYEVILGELNENLVKATSARDALEYLLKTDVAVILIDVCMPDLDGFDLAAMIREHPRFERTAIIFVSAIMLAEPDRLRGYQAGAVDYVSVPVVPEVLRAKVRVFADLYRKTRQLEQLNAELEARVAERTVELETSNARLRESEQRRSVALAAGQMGAWEWDVETGAVDWDDGQYRIFGIAPGSVKMTIDRVRPYIEPEDMARVEALIRSQTGDIKTFQTEVRVRRPDGDMRWCICAAAVTHEAGRNAPSVSGVTIDITDRKRVEQALQSLNEELEHRIEERTREREHALAQLFEAQKMDTIGQLTGGVAHDFNNLLMAVLGSLELLRKRLPPDERTRRLLDNAIQGAERGAALTQRLLAFARRQELTPRALSIQELMIGMEDLLKRALGPTVVISKNIPIDLPAVLVDVNQLELAILNIAVNARDAMPNGGRLEISALSEIVVAEGRDQLTPGEYVRINFADNGIGMDETTLARATEPFFTTKELGKGTGLGLSMVHGLAAQSGGRLRLSSTGEGATIELWLPASKVAASRVADANEQTLASVNSRVMRPYTVLVVDDDPLVSLGTVAMLEDLGHTAIGANSAAQALEVLRSGQAVDVVLTDHAMPGMTGLELVQQIRTFYPELTVVLASGYAELPNNNAYNDLPRLSKPFSLTQLESLIASVAP